MKPELSFFFPGKAEYMRRLFVLALFMAVVPPSAFAHNAAPCVSAEQAAQMLNKDVCVSAHVYDVVQIRDGTRYLDICSRETPDEQCRFTIVSYWSDRDTVGELDRYRNSNVQVQGRVESMHGRAALVLSHNRQFRGGPPKFRPNPRLLHGFDGDTSRPAVADPNLRAHGAARSFMNKREQERLPAK
jgi:hypothetical protein